MHSSRNHRAHFASVLVGLVSLAMMPAQAADDYLDILEAEAADTGSVGSSGGIVEAPPPKSLSPQRHITPGLGFEAFGEELRTRYAGTHLLYMKLTAANRRAAWKSYQRDNTLTSVRETIVTLLSSG